MCPLAGGELTKSPNKRWSMLAKVCIELSNGIKTFYLCWEDTVYRDIQFCVCVCNKTPNVLLDTWMTTEDYIPTISNSSCSQCVPDNECKQNCNMRLLTKCPQRKGAPFFPFFSFLQVERLKSHLRSWIDLVEEQAEEGATVPADPEVAKPVPDCSNPDLVYMRYTNFSHG